MEKDKNGTSPESQAAIYVAMFEVYLGDLKLPQLSAKENLDLTKLATELIHSNPNTDFSVGDIPPKSR